MAKNKLAAYKSGIDNAFTSVFDKESATPYSIRLENVNKAWDGFQKNKNYKSLTDEEKKNYEAKYKKTVDDLNKLIKKEQQEPSPPPAPKPTEVVGGAVSANNSNVNNTETKANPFELTEEQMNNVNQARNKYLNKHSDRVSKKEEALSNAKMSVFDRKKKIADAQKALNKQNASKDWYENNLYGKDLAAKKAEKMEEDYRTLNEYNNTLHNDDKIYEKNLSDAQKTRLQKRRNNGNELQKMADEAGLKYSSLVWDAVGNGLKSMSNAMSPLTGQKPFEDTQSPFSKRMNSRLAAATAGQTKIIELENEAIEKARGIKLDDKGNMVVGNTPINLKDYMTNDMNFAALTAEGKVKAIKEILGTVNLAGHSIDIDGLIKAFTKRLNNGENAIETLWDLLKRSGTNISWGN